MRILLMLLFSVTASFAYDGENLSVSPPLSMVGSAISLQNAPTVVVSSSDFTTAGTVLANIPSLSIALTQNATYQFDFYLMFQTTTTTTGARFGISVPAGSSVTYTARIPIAADGAGGEFQGWGSTPSDPVIGTAVQAVNTSYLARISGICLTGTGVGGYLSPQAASELAGNPTVLIKAGSVGIMRMLTASN